MATSLDAEMTTFEIDQRISVAPMMDWTDRHCRYFLRGFSPRVLLYTEMITAAAIVHGDRARLLRYSGGAAAGTAARWQRPARACGRGPRGRRRRLRRDQPELRLSERSGACRGLRRLPDARAERVAECVAAMRAAVRMPVTVKMRIGVVSRSGRAGAQLAQL